MHKEIWKDIKGYEGLYQVSNLGRVRSLKRLKKNKGEITYKYLSSDLKNTGYEYVVLCVNYKKVKKYVHRLVAKAFLENEFEKPTVNHKDLNPLNNTLSNLEWNTFSENIKHSYLKNKKRKRARYFKGRFNDSRLGCKKVAAFFKDGSLFRVFSSTMDADRFGYNSGAVAACARGEANYHKNLIWKYV
jgi:hypothetical protein